jgi:chromosome segregation ATPase
MYSSYSIHIRSLEEEQGDLNQKLRSQEASIQHLRAQLGTLGEKRNQYNIILQEVEELQSQTGPMRFEAEKSGEQLCHAQIVLDGIRNGLEVMA